MTFDGLNPPYPTIVADPAWPFRWDGRAGGTRRNDRTRLYTRMTLEDILALPVSELAAPNAHLYLWVTPELYRQGIGVQTAEAWGFTAHDELIWEKPNLGMGAFPRHCHEPVLIARRGELEFTAPLNVRSVQRWKQPQTTNGGKTHSAKPDGLMDLVESASPGPYLELFARAPRLGWDSWGHGYEGSA